MAIAKISLHSILNQFHDTDLFLYPLKTSENQRFFYVFRGYRKRSVAWNGLRVQRRLIFAKIIRCSRLRLWLVYLCSFNECFQLMLFSSIKGINGLISKRMSNIYLQVTIHQFTGNDYVVFKEIWNEFRGVRNSNFLNLNVRKRSIHNKLFIHSVKIYKDFFKLIYYCYGLRIIRKN